MKRTQTYAIVIAVTVIATVIYRSASVLIPTRAGFLVFVTVFLGLALLLQHFVHKRQQ